MTIEHKRTSKAEIEDLIKARYSLIWITSPEENRVEEALRKLCVEREMRLEVWSVTEGFKTAEVRRDLAGNGDLLVRRTETP